MVAGEEMETVRKGVFRGVGEAVVGSTADDTGGEEVGEAAIPGDLAEANDDSDAWEGTDLGGEVDGAVTNLLGSGLVAGWSAADDGGDPGMAQAEAVVAGGCVRLIRETEVVEYGIHEIARSVAGEGAASAIGPVGSGSEAEDEDAGAGVTEARDGACPVVLVLIGAAAGFADASTVGAQAGTEFTGDDGVADVVQVGGWGGKLAKRLRRRKLRRARGAGRFWTDGFH